MIRILYFICIIFVRKYNYILASINSESSRVIFFPFFVFIQWVKHFCTPANFVTICVCAVLNNKIKILIYNLCFGSSKLYTNIQLDQKANLDYHIVYGGRGGGLEVLKCFVRGGQNFFYLLCVCMCVCVWGGGGIRFSTSPSVQKNNRPPPINK